MCPTLLEELEHAAAHRDYWIDVYAVHAISANEKP